VLRTYAAWRGRKLKHRREGGATWPAKSTRNEQMKHAITKKAGQAEFGSLRRRIVFLPSKDCELSLFPEKLIAALRKERTA